MKSIVRLVCLSTLALTLAACQGEKTAQKGTAEGEILPGSASDAMLPLDTVRSQPPLAPMPETSGKPKKADGEDEKSESEEDASGEGIEVPTASPAATGAAPASAPAAQ